MLAGTKAVLAQRIVDSEKARNHRDASALLSEWQGDPLPGENEIALHYADYFSVIDKVDQAVKTNFHRKPVRLFAFLSVLPTYPLIG